MSLGIRLQGASNLGEVDASGQQRVITYDASGNAIGVVNKTSLATNIGGVLMSGNEYRTARSLRVDEAGTLRTSDESLLLYDNTEGATVDTNKWIQTTASFTIAQTAATGINLNSSASTTSGQGAMHTSHRFFPFYNGAIILSRFKIKPNTHSNNNLHEVGFGTPASSTAASIGSGACWRKDASGQWLPVVSFNGTEQLGTPISNATFIASVPVTDYANFVVELRETLARFSIYTLGGVLVTSQDLDFSGTTNVAGFNGTHAQGMYRSYNSGTVGTGVQLIVKEVSYILLDVASARPWNIVQSGMGYNSATSPTVYTQNANYGNSAAPTTRTLSNTAAAETTLGGLLRVNSIAGGNTDYIMFGWTNPSPYTFFCDSVWIPAPLNEVVAVVTTATIFSYFISFNSSAVSLATAAPYSPMRVALPGFHTAAIAAAANTAFSGNTIQMIFPTPFAVQPGRFLHIGCREWVGSATATETYLWAGVGVGGFFE